MAAITGNYTPPNKGIGDWAIDWLRISDRWTSPRKFLAEQLRYIRKAHGTHEAREFRSYLLWIGVYPIRRRQLQAD